MARILYGVSGEGSGHSSRAHEVLPDLIDHGHEVRVATYARGITNLAHDYDCIEIEGLTIVSRDNQVSRIGTVIENLRRSGRLIRRFRQLRREGVREFRPDVVI
ncbi:MAG: glycosyltransferase family protein, partial [Gammaproteobacteria bacterium]